MVQLYFFFIFSNQLEFHKTPKGPPSTIFSLRCSADFGRYRLVGTNKTGTSKVVAPLKVQKAQSLVEIITVAFSEFS